MIFDRLKKNHSAFMKMACLLLSTLLLASCVSCSSGEVEINTDTSTETENTFVSEEETEDPRYSCSLPDDLSFEGQTVNMILPAAQVHMDEFICESLGGGVVSDAVYERNLAVENMLGIDLEFYDGHVIVDVDRDIKSGVGEYELVANYTFQACVPAIEGQYLNLSSFNNIDTSKMYWNQGYNEMSTFTSENIQYLASGPMAITMFRYAFLTLYNRTLFEEYKMDDLFQTVKDGQWTLDYQYSLLKNHYADSDGDGEVSKDDFFGFVTGDTISVDPYMVTSDIHMIIRDPVTGDLTFNGDGVSRISDLCDKLQLIYNDQSTYAYKGVTEDVIASNSVIDHFTGSKALMATTLFYKMETSYEDLGAMAYGIAPIPKYDTHQENYHSYVQAEVTSFGISAGIGDPARQEKCAAALEALAYHSYLLVRPAYYGTVLSERYMQDPESVEMLDLIFDTLDFDFASCWSDILGTANIRNGLRPILSGKNNTVSSTFRGWQRSIERSLGLYNDQIIENAG